MKTLGEKMRARHERTREKIARLSSRPIPGQTPAERLKLGLLPDEWGVDMIAAFFHQKFVIAYGSHAIVPPNRFSESWRIALDEVQKFCLDVRGSLAERHHDQTNVRHFIEHALQNEARLRSGLRIRCNQLNPQILRGYKESILDDALGRRVIRWRNISEMLNYSANNRQSNCVNIDPKVSTSEII